MFYIASGREPGTIDAQGKPARKKSDRVYTWNCAYCGQSFQTTEYSQRYCKPYHKKLAYLARRAEK